MNLEEGAPVKPPSLRLLRDAAAPTLSARFLFVFALQLLRDAAIGIPGSGVSRTAGRRDPNLLALEILSNNRAVRLRLCFEGAE